MAAIGTKVHCLRWTFVLSSNMSVALYSVLTIVLLLIPTHFNYNALYVSSGRTPSNDSLAMSMTVLQFCNYFYRVPEAYFNVSDGQMTDFWFLPPGTRLSPLMQAIARCRMTADLKRDGDPQFPVEVCNRVPVGWPWLAIMVAVICLIDIVNGHVKRLVVLGRSEETNANAMKAARNHAFFHAIAWLVLVAVISFVPAYRDNHIGMTYTLRDEVYPKPFYGWASSWTWIVGFSICSLGFKAIEVICLVHCGASFKTKKGCCKKTKKQIQKKSTPVDAALDRPEINRRAGTAVSCSEKLQEVDAPLESPSSASSSTSWIITVK